MMTIDQIVNSLEKLSKGTDFLFKISENKNEEIELLVDGDNPQCEDWCFYITIETPDTEEDLAKCLSKEFWNLYNDYDVEENVYMWLEAKRNGVSGVPGVIDTHWNWDVLENIIDYAKSKYNGEELIKFLINIIPEVTYEEYLMFM